MSYTRIQIFVLIMLLATVLGLSAGNLYDRDAEAVQRVQNLYYEFGLVMPSVSYPVREADLHWSLMQLHSIVMEKEQNLQLRVERWEELKVEIQAELEREKAKRTEENQPEKVEEEPAEIIRVLVWPPPGDDEEGEAVEVKDPLQELERIKPHADLEAIQELRFRIEDELEVLEFRRHEDAAIGLRQKISLQGFLNSPLNSMTPREYYALVTHPLQYDLRFGYSGQPSIQVTAGLVRGYGVGQEFTNLPIPTDQVTVPLDGDAFTRVLLNIPFGYGDITLGRFPVHLGTGLNSLCASSEVPYFDGVRLATRGSFLKTSHVGAVISSREAGKGDVSDSSFPSNYDFGETTIVYVLHYAEAFLGKARIGIGGQSMVAAPNNSVDFQNYLPLVPWVSANSPYTNTQLIGDVTFAPAPWLELYLQGGVQSPPDGWGILGLHGAVIGGGKVVVVSPDGVSTVQLEAGWTSSKWGSYSDEYALSRFIQRVGTGQNSTGMAISSPYGPGVIWGSGILGFQSNKGFAADFIFEIMGKNTSVDLISGSYAATGASYELFSIVSLNFEYAWDNQLSVQLRPSVGQYPQGFVPSVSLTVRFDVDYL